MGAELLPAASPAPADLVIAVSTRLAELLREAGVSDVHLVGNGVDYDLFRAAAESGVPDDMKGMRRPVIGYSGAVAQWFDFELLDPVAASFPHASIVMVGPLFGDRGRGARGDRLAPGQRVPSRGEALREARELHRGDGRLHHSAQDERAHALGRSEQALRVRRVRQADRHDEAFGGSRASAGHDSPRRVAGGVRRGDPRRARLGREPGEAHRVRAEAELAGARGRDRLAHPGIESRGSARNGTS